MNLNLIEKYLGESKKIKYYATIKSNNNIGYWEELKNVKNIAAAKRKAVKELEGSGSMGDELRVVELQAGESEYRLNDLPYYVKIIGSKKWSYKS